MPATSYYSSYYGGTVAAPVTTYYAPYTSYYSPYVPGQPVRNAFRSLFYSRRSSRPNSTTGAVCSGVVMPGGSSRMRMLRKWISAPSDSRHR